MSGGDGDPDMVWLNGKNAAGCTAVFSGARKACCGDQAESANITKKIGLALFPTFKPIELPMKGGLDNSAADEPSILCILKDYASMHSI